MSTHPQRWWLDALEAGGRLVLPLTVSFPGMGSLGKGVTVLVTKTTSTAFRARVLAVTIIYSAVELRDEELGARLGRALRSGSVSAVTRLRADAHAPRSSCWLHAEPFGLAGN